MRKRAVLIVLDGVGVGEMRDSYQYGDQGSHSLKNTALAVGGLKIPNLQKLGLGNIDAIPGVEPAIKPAAAYGKMEERSCGKDSTVGHWEMMGLIKEKAFPTYPEGFPQQIIDEFERAIGRKTIGNKVASGTQIINELGAEHIKTGYPIVYTSADSVFQIAAHEEVVPVEQLYQWCQIARGILLGEHGVGRVIARPFIGKPGTCTRTSNRHDFSLEPGRNVLDILLDNGMTVIGVGKIKDLFAGRGLSESYPTSSNQQGIIGALAGAGLRMSGNDGRFQGRLQLKAAGEIMTVEEIKRSSDIDSVETMDAYVLPETEEVVIGPVIKTVLLDHKRKLLVYRNQSDRWQNCSKQQLRQY